MLMRLGFRETDLGTISLGKPQAKRDIGLNIWLVPFCDA